MSGQRDAVRDGVEETDAGGESAMLANRGKDRQQALPDLLRYLRQKRDKNKIHRELKHQISMWPEVAVAQGPNLKMKWKISISDLPADKEVVCCRLFAYLGDGTRGGDAVPSLPGYGGGGGGHRGGLRLEGGHGLGHPGGEGKLFSQLHVSAPLGCKGLFRVRKKGQSNDLE